MFPSGEFEVRRLSWQGVMPDLMPGSVSLSEKDCGLTQGVDTNGKTFEGSTMRIPPPARCPDGGRSSSPSRRFKNIPGWQKVIRALMPGPASLPEKDCG